MNKNNVKKIPVPVIGITLVRYYSYLALISLFMLTYFTSCEHMDKIEKESTTLDAKDDANRLKTGEARTNELYEYFEKNAEILLGPEILIIEGETFKLYKFQIDKELFERFKEPFVLYLKNGSGTTETSLMEAKVTIDENVIISQRGFTKSKESLRRQIQLNKNSQIEVLIGGVPNSFCELTIKGIPKSDTITDYDGNTYNTVKIGNQEWMAENLKVTHYANGMDIPLVTDNMVWVNLGNNNTDKAYCYYNNSDANRDIYGALYTYAAATNGDNDGTTQGVCPTGWHLPSDAEWTELTDYLGGVSVAGGKIKEVGKTHWNNPNTGATNESNFSALPGGYRIGNGTFNDIGNTGEWWSSTEYQSISAWPRHVYNYSNSVERFSYPKHYGFSVRCLKD